MRKSPFYQIEDKSLTRTILKTRRKILDNAYRLFSTEGIFNTTMVDISNETGITRRTLYNHYITKEEIALTLHKLLIDEMLLGTGREGDEKTLNFLKNSLYSIFEELIHSNGKSHFLVHFDQYARENRELFDESSYFVPYLMKHSPLLEYLIFFKKRGHFLDDSIIPEMMCRVCFESFIAFLERINYQESSNEDKESDFDLYINTMLKFISEEKNCGY